MRISSLLPLFFLLVSSFTAKAQWSPVIETKRNMSFGERPCFRLELSQTETGLLEDMWKDYAKKMFSAKLKKDKKSGEWSATGLTSALMGSDPFAIYSTVEKSNNGSVLTVWFDAGSYFLNRSDNSSRSEEISRSLKQFYYDVRRATINLEVKEQESKMKELEKRQKKLMSDNDKLRKDIEDYKAKIAKAEADVVKNEKDQEAMVVDMDAQRRTIEDVKARLLNVENEKN